MRRLSADEAALWARVIASVEPIPGRTPAPRIVPLVPGQVDDRPASKPRTDPRPAAAPVPAARKPAANTLDGSWDRRLSRGMVQPDLSIDLHGHTLDSAYRTLDQGLDHAVRSGARTVLLVAGRAREGPSGRGAIRRAVGDWLAASRHADAIAAVRGAHPRHGGAGALYIILRRPRGTASS